MPIRLRRIAALALTAALVVVATGCRPQTNGSVSGAADQPAGIAVNGTGSVSVQPDVAVLNLGTTVTAPTVAAARDRAATAMQAVQSAVRSKGVDEKDIRTVAFNINPQI